jgi:uncharacterized protein (DUF362 family)/ferredoxin
MIKQAGSLQNIREAIEQILITHQDLLPRELSSLVLIKPNLNAYMNALTGNTTDLRLISALLGQLKDLGYKNLLLADGPNSGYHRNKINVIQSLRIDRLASFYGARTLDLNCAQGRSLMFEDNQVVQAAQTCFQADLFINLPKLKTHAETGLSLCLKNLVGCLVGPKSKKRTHQALAANILHLNVQLRPHLHIVDALVAMQGLGPSKGDPLLLELLLAGRDPFVLDLVCTRLAGFDLAMNSVLLEAQRRGLLNAERLKAAAQVDTCPWGRSFAQPSPGFLASFVNHPKRQKYFLAARSLPPLAWLAETSWVGRLLNLTGLRQDYYCRVKMSCQSLHLDQALCDGCGVCQEFCPQGLNPVQEAIASDLCLACLYCYMICPAKAFSFLGQAGFLKAQLRSYDTASRALGLQRKQNKQKL